MKKLAFMIPFLSASAFAVSVQFNFDVNSSGASIYPCDAGIMHSPHATNICYDRYTNNYCDTKSCAEGEPCDCICTGTNEGPTQDFKLDSLKATFSEWSDNGAPVPAGKEVSIGAGETTFARIFTSKDEWDYQLTSLSFDLGSERYGTDFYLDVCYRGPQTKPQGNPNYVMKLDSTLTDLVATNGLKYSELADFKTRVEATCDLQGSGAFSGVPTDNAQDHQITDISGGDISFSTSYASYSAGSSLSLLNDWINKGNNKTPRFCKIRYYFTENMRNNAADPLATIRRWTNHKARISTLSDIAVKNQL